MRGPYWGSHGLDEAESTKARPDPQAQAEESGSWKNDDKCAVIALDLYLKCCFS